MYPLKKNLINPQNAEQATVRQYLENNQDCRRQQLLKYFDSDTRVCNLIPDASKYGQLYLDDGTSPAHSIYART